MGFLEEDDDGISFEEKISTLKKQLNIFQESSSSLDKKINHNLKKIGLFKDVQD